MEWISGNVFIRATKMAKAGEPHPGHRHNFDHTTVVFTGAVHVRKCLQRVNDNGAPMFDTHGAPILIEVMNREFKAPAHFLVEAEAWHQIVATEDNTEFWCVYSHRTPQGDVVQHYTGWESAHV